MAASKRLRFEVFKRDKFTCQYCGRRPPDVMLEADHIVPVVAGGPDTIENLTTACQSCNRGKAGIPLGSVAPALDEMEQLAALQEMLERRSAMAQQISLASATDRTETEAIALVRRWWDDATGAPEVFDVAGVRRFVRELQLERIREAILAAETFASQHEDYRTRDPGRLWRYFSGVCWKMIRAEDRA